jgi:hypothetical protein
VSRRDIKVLRAAFPECAVTRGWHLSGPGPARYGWAAIHPSGAVRYLGHSASAAVQSILRAIDDRNDAELQRRPNDHLSPGHVHRASYGGDGCSICDDLLLGTVRS